MQGMRKSVPVFRAAAHTSLFKYKSCLGLRSCRQRRQADVISSPMSFLLGPSDEIVRAVTGRGYTDPTIQMQALILAVLQAGDLLAGAQTGTGKTGWLYLRQSQRLSDKIPKGPSSGRPPRSGR